MDKLEARKYLERKKAQIVLLMVSLALCLPTLYVQLSKNMFMYVVVFNAMIYIFTALKLRKLNFKLNALRE